ncbi:hypothetical protein SXANM310S_03949 [Streptomyces xanthochromogenes]
MAQHPLAALRASVGLSHAAYAQLVADAHAALGFGPLAARREKVARWESGRTVPSPTTQLAIAHVHGVPESDVALLGWPMWLSPAGRAAASAEEQPWTAKAAAGRAREAAGPVTGNAFRLVLAVSGHALLVQMQKALTALEHPRTAHTQPGHVVPPASLDWAESRLRSLERLSAREREVLELLVDGLSNADIGHQLHLSMGTVKDHVRSVLTKLRVNNRVQAAVLAIRAGLGSAPGRVR